MAAALLVPVRSLNTSWLSRIEVEVVWSPDWKDLDGHRLPALAPFRIDPNEPLLERISNALDADPTSRDCGRTEEPDRKLAERHDRRFAPVHELRFRDCLAVPRRGGEIVSENFREWSAVISDIRFVPSAIQFDYRCLIATLAVHGSSTFPSPSVVGGSLSEPAVERL
jgi:hypothetical protein